MDAERRGGAADQHADHLHRLPRPARGRAVGHLGHRPGAGRADAGRGDVGAGARGLVRPRRGRRQGVDAELRRELGPGCPAAARDRRLDDRGDRAGLAFDAMGAAVLTTKHRWRRWSELSRVERVGLYTRQSLYVMLWSFNGSVLVGAAVNDESTAAVEILGGGLAVTALAFAAFMSMLRRFPALHPLPWRWLAPLFVSSAAFLAVAVASWAGPTRGAAVHDRGREPDGGARAAAGPGDRPRARSGLRAAVRDHRR